MGESDVNTALIIIETESVLHLNIILERSTLEYKTFMNIMQKKAAGWRRIYSLGC